MFRLLNPMPLVAVTLLGFGVRLTIEYSASWRTLTLTLICPVGSLAFDWEWPRRGHQHGL